MDITLAFQDGDAVGLHHYALAYKKASAIRINYRVFKTEDVPFHNDELLRYVLNAVAGGGGGGRGGGASAPNPRAASAQKCCWGLRPQIPAGAPPQTPLRLRPRPSWGLQSPDFPPEQGLGRIPNSLHT